MEFVIRNTNLSTQAVLKPRFAPQDWVQAIGQDSRLSQKAVLRILQVALADAHCAQQFVRNPVLFAQQASALIRRAERDQDRLPPRHAAGPVARPGGPVPRRPRADRRWSRDRSGFAR